MIPMNNRLQFHKLVLLLLASAFGITILLCVLAESRHREYYQMPLLTDDNSYSLKDGWHIQSSDGSLSSSLTAPFELEYQNEGRYTLTVTLPEDLNFSVRPVLFFCTNHMDIQASLNGKQLYSCQSTEHGFSKTPGNRYHMIELPDDYAGKELRIELIMLLGDSILYTVPTPIIAVQATIVNHIFKAELPSVAILSFVLSFGIILLFLSILFRKISGNSKNLLFTGVFAILFSCYALCETELIHFLIPNSYLIYLCDFLLFALLPIPLLMILRGSTADRFWKMIDFAVIVMFVNFGIQIAFNYLGILDLREMLPLTHIMDLTGILLFVFCLFIRPDKEKVRSSHLRLAFLPVLAGALTDLVLFYIPSVIAENSFFFQFGVLLFVNTQLFFAIQSYLNLYIQKVHTDYYEKMAFTDALTCLGNRLAFQKALERLENKTADCIPVLCISADINNLKIVNDTFGHSEGDRLITGAADIFRTVSSHSYRIGGDEFVMFFCHAGNELQDEKLNAIQNEIDRYNKSHEITLSIALGCEILSAEGESISALLARADKQMYERKASMKETADKL